MGAVYEYEYDLLGRKVREIDANKNATEYIYDKLGRVIQKMFHLTKMVKSCILNMDMTAWEIKF